MLAIVIMHLPFPKLIVFTKIKKTLLSLKFVDCVSSIIVAWLHDENFVFNIYLTWITASYLDILLSI